MNFLLAFLKNKIFGFKSRRRAFVLVGLFMSLLIVWVVIFWSKDFTRPDGIEYGVTFSKFYAEELGLNWREVYLAILDDLQAERVRLPIYWPDIEPLIDEFDFSDYDWMFEQAERRGVALVPVVGQRVPRWPECHIPPWVGRLRSQASIDKELLDMVEQVVRRYKSYDSVIGWQVENEPFLSFFGQCPPFDADIFDQEIALVRSLDTDRPIIMTDSGELSLWQATSERGDTLGITLYRLVWNPIIGYFGHIYPPAFYRYRADKAIADNPNLHDVIVMELQAEPWVNGQSITQASLAEQYRSMDVDRLRNIIAFTERVGFSQAYFWGTEWWYWLKVRHDDNDFWELGKTFWL